MGVKITGRILLLAAIGTLGMISDATAGSAPHSPSLSADTVVSGPLGYNLQPHLALTGETPDPDTAVTSPPSPSSPPRPLSPGLPMTYGDQLRSYRQLERKPDADAAVTLGGLVVDETITPQGRLFYAAFYDIWRSPSTPGFYTVRVEEQPTPGRGTLIRVIVNDTPTFQSRLQPDSVIDDLALPAARRTYAHVQSGRGILKIR